jgi:hypothetical protein
MRKKKAKAETGRATLDRVRKEMARPRVAKSARRPTRVGERREPHLGGREVV